MGVYVKEFYPMQGCKGEKILSLLTEQSMRTKSVNFEVYHSDSEWNLYWNMEIPPIDFLPVMKKYAKKEAILQEAMKDEIVLREVLKLSKTYVCQLSVEEVAIIKRIVEKGLPDLNRRKPQGLDGHSYELKLYTSEKEYRCWCVIPKEWKELIPLIKLFVAKAELNERYLIDGIN